MAMMVDSANRMLKVVGTPNLVMDIDGRAELGGEPGVKVGGSDEADEIAYEHRPQSQ